VSGIAGVTIDGVAASAAGSTFTATIPVGCGAHSAAVTATDHAGRTASTAVALERACAGFSAVFAPPIDVDEVNVAKHRRTIPVKVEVFALDGSEDRVGPLTLVVSPSDCVPRVEMDSVETYTTASTTETAFRWSADGDQWIYNLSVSSLPGAAPDKCYRADVVRNDVVVGSFAVRVTK